MSHIASPEEMYLHPVSEMSGQLAQLEVEMGRIAGCEKVARVEEVVVPPVQGQACAGQGLGQAGLADDHQLPGGGGPAHSPGSGEE